MSHFMKLSQNDSLFSMNSKLMLIRSLWLYSYYFYAGDGFFNLFKLLRRRLRHIDERWSDSIEDQALYGE